MDSYPYYCQSSLIGGYAHQCERPHQNALSLFYRERQQATTQDDQ
jgi:hypothetical protein